MLFIGAFTVNHRCLTIGNKASDKLSERGDRTRASERGRAQSKMEVKQAGGSFTLPGGACWNTHDDVACMTVMMLSLYAYVDSRAHASLQIAILFWYSLIAQIITKRNARKISRPTLSLKASDEGAWS